MRNFLFVIFFFSIVSGFSQDYQFKNKSGVHMSLNQLIDSIKDSDVVLFGEYHDDSICHELQFQLTKQLFEIKKEKLVLGSEMFETDNQLIIDEYLYDEISTKSFEQECRLWSNYIKDYKPVLEFAKLKSIKYFATNVPRRYASVVYKKGYEGLKDFSKKTRKEYIAKEPINYDKNLPTYKEMLSMMHGNENLPKAQALKDATMAQFIYKNRKGNELFLHFNGCYHSDYYEGIYWHLKGLKNKLVIKTISILREEDEITEKEKAKADYILYIK